ncbi:nuclease-related domain-containing protein [Jeotgalibaca sp. A122]|uniref:nuclease-related domain-containing protein n=1 Tax=Jeotgalibaca sp. A122 TaxID=3457322 RepID=UPI003FD07220
MELLTLIFYIYLFIYFTSKRPYQKSGYQEASGHSFWETMMNAGLKGEYLTYRHLTNLGEENKILTNVYLPKQDGTTTEIDLIMLAPTGIYVFESKNYSGWIFGDENSRYWTQMFQNRKKFRFYNPIWQNKQHINIIRQHLDAEEKVFKSYIVFSQRCELKKMHIHSNNVKVMKRNVMVKAIKHDMAESANFLTSWEITKYYNQLARYAWADDTTKQAHIDAMTWRN